MTGATRPLDGLVVLDLTRLLPGAVATQTLARFGAEVIKIEEPRRGDYGRSMPPLVDGAGAIFRRINRGKKSVALDLKKPRGQEALSRLAERADVLIEGFRPGVMKRLGVDYDTLASRNPRLIYVALSGYGQSGPYCGLAGHDVNYLALAGVLDLIGDERAPAIPGVQIADLAGGAMQAVIGVLLALAARARTGRGQFVDISMTDGSAALLEVPRALFEATGRTPERALTTLSGRYACYNVYRAADGRWIAVGALEPKFWETLCRGLGREDLASEQFVEGERREQIKQELVRIFSTRPASEWFELLGGQDACLTPVLTVAEAAPARIMPALGDTPATDGGAVPRLGEHTHEVLGRAGFSESEMTEISS